MLGAKFWKISFLALAGCSGSSDFKFSAPDAESFDDAVSGYLEIAEEFESAGYDITPNANLPTTDVPANYDGYILLDAYGPIDGLREEYGGDAVLTANFDSNTVSGTADNFFDSSNRPLSGALAISAGTIDRTADPVTEWQITASVDGILTDADSILLDVSAVMDGDFLGPNAQGYYSIIDGTMSSTAYGDEFLFGTSIGQR